MKNSIAYISRPERKSRLTITLVMTIMALMGVIFMHTVEAKAAGASVAITEVNYSESTITVRLNAADTMLFISDGKQKKWDIVPVSPDVRTHEVKLDISWISQTADYTISFKGNYSTEPVKAVIPKQVTNLRATYSTYTGVVTFTNAGKRTVEWRKKDSYTWNTVPSDTALFKEQLLSMCPNGASLLFRLAPENGTSATNMGCRAGKEIACNIPKKTAAPAITVNDENLMIPLLRGMQYRYTNSEGNPIAGVSIEGKTLKSGEWADISKSYDCPIKEIAMIAMYDPKINPVPTDVYIQFRTAATSSKQVSNYVTVKIPAQKAMSASAIAGAQLEYTSSTTFEITINAAGPDNPYEYCIIDTYDLRDGITIEKASELKWKTINSVASFPIDGEKEKIKNGSLVYFRKKALKSLGDDEYELASPSVLLAEIKYPGDVAAAADGSLVWLQTIAGVCSTENYSGYIAFDMYSPSKQIVKEMKMVGYLNKEAYGTLGIKSEVRENPGSLSDNDKYIITTTITSTANIDERAANENTRRMLAYFTFQNADGTSSSGSFESSDEEGGIALYIYPASTINNPSGSGREAESKEIASELAQEAKNPNHDYWAAYDYDKDFVEYSTAFRRIYLSNRAYSGRGSLSDCDPTSFRVKLELGTPKVPTTASGKTYETYSAEDTEVVSIKYDGVTFVAGQSDATGKQYFVTDYANVVKNNKIQRIAVVTINADAIEKSAEIDDRNKATTLYINLNNGETIKAVSMNLVESATIDSRPLSWSITEGSLETTKSVTKTDSSGSSTTSTEKLTECEFYMTVFDPSYSIVVSDVTWDNTSVLDTASVKGGKIDVKLSNEKLNTLTVSQGAVSHELVITFNNGYRITTGATLTVTPKSGK